jgi:hypothetical protein
MPKLKSPQSTAHSGMHFYCGQWTVDRGLLKT